jgi:hypothetical protein
MAAATVSSSKTTQVDFMDRILRQLGVEKVTDGLASGALQHFNKLQDTAADTRSERAAELLAGRFRAMGCATGFGVPTLTRWQRMQLDDASIFVEAIAENPADVQALGVLACYLAFPTDHPMTARDRVHA